MFSLVLMALVIKTFAFCPTCTENSLVIVLDPEALFFFVLNYASPSTDRREWLSRGAIWYRDEIKRRFVKVNDAHRLKLNLTKAELSVCFL